MNRLEGLTAFAFSVFSFALFSLLLSFPVLSQEVSMEIEGECREYNVTIVLENFEPACYDVKVDVTTPAGRVGRIFDPREGWKSSFFYVNEGICVDGENTTVNGTYSIRAETSSPLLNFRSSIRHASRRWETGFVEFGQDCPASSPVNLPEQQFFLAVLMAVTVILAGIVLQKRAVGAKKKSKE